MIGTSTGGIFEHFNPGFIATITFALKGNETSMVWTMLFETSEKRETLVKVFKADVGLEQNGDKLVAYLRNNKAL